MFQNQQIARGIYYTGVNDRQKERFENRIPLPNGVAYNSYLIVDDKTALIDTVDVSFGDVFIDKVQSQLGDRPLDYLIINHMEPDHSGSIRLIRKYYPGTRIVANGMALGMVEGYYGVAGNTLEIHDGERFSLGGHQLQFHFTPMVHWPETMMTWDQTERVLFSGDAFGCFGALNGGVMDTQMNVAKYRDEMIRYYANIVGKYGVPVQKALQKLAALPFEVICSTHGPVWKEHVAEVVDLYSRLSRYEGVEGVVIAYGSMYGNTELMAETVAQGAVEAGIRDVVVHNVSRSDPSVMLRDIFKYSGLIVGSPTYCGELYPEVEALLREIETRGVKNRMFGYFGSFTWAGAAVKRLAAFGQTMQWTTAEVSIEEKRGMKTDNYQACLKLGRQIAELVKQSAKK
jgi:flavorubredoxin